MGEGLKQGDLDTEEKEKKATDGNDGYGWQRKGQARSRNQGKACRWSWIVPPTDDQGTRHSLLSQIL